MPWKTSSSNSINPHLIMYTKWTKCYYNIPINLVTEMHFSLTLGSMSETSMW